MSLLLHYDPDDPYPESDGQPIADNSVAHVSHYLYID